MAEEQASARRGGGAGKRRPDLDSLYTVNEDGSRNFLHPADVSGRWQSRKNVIWAALMAIYAGLPWLKIGGEPAVLFDIPGRHAYLFGGTFTNQDFYLVFFLISGIGFSLFVLTSLLGRVWCGFACPQTVFLEGVFRKAERWIEGSRETRIRRNRKGPSFDRTWRKTVKHILYVLFSFVIAHIFLSYFIPVDKLRLVLTGNPADHPVAFFWSMFWTAVLYFDYAWFREQTCLIICPYGRLQSTLTDADTILIGYDEARGEPRSPKHEERGDCIDCYRCVAVCPTGIDIRNGVQMECIGCSNCIDACDAIMDRIGRPRGLVRYDSERGFETGGARRTFLRPRVFAYGFLMLLGAGVFTVAASHRSSFEVNVLRQKGLPFVIEEGRIRNLVTLHIQNKSPETRVFLIRPRLDETAGSFDIEFVIPTERVAIDGLGDREVPLFVSVTKERYHDPFKMGIAVTDSTGGTEKVISVRFRGP